MMSNLDFDRAAALADMCRLLTACYYEPGPEFAEEKIFDSLAEAAGRIDPLLVTHALQLKTAFESESHDNLLVDYSRLFLGPGGILALPYESAWLEKDSNSSIDATQLLLELFEDGGFEMDTEFKDLPDHLAVELEFLYTLLFRIAAAIQTGDQRAMDSALALRWSLLEQHLGRWIEDFQKAVHAGAGCRFYRELVDLTVLFVSLVRNDQTAGPSC
jgi:TorA maturation chaperone TorD